MPIRGIGAEQPTSLADGDWLGTREAARRLGLASRTLYRLIDVGELPAYRFGQVIRLKGCDLDLFVERSRDGGGGTQAPARPGDGGRGGRPVGGSRSTRTKPRGHGPSRRRARMGTRTQVSGRARRSGRASCPAGADLHGPAGPPATPAVPAGGAFVHALAGPPRCAQPARRLAPRSVWWREVNERLLRDGCEAVALSGPTGGPSSPSVRLWLGFIAGPTAQLVSSSQREHRERLPGAPATRRGRERTGALRHERRAGRVLYTHAIVAAPRLALGG